ncbi:MAG: NADH-quinone oxidoreductase subunit NuoN [Alphaproteobacteria bacterium]|nr:NADH-quinone oxidoreductase subunit NuoN [Alphaproteobacteria bacterium]OJU57626.1 MAG: NADH-quinone oxidoreductase subunit N [Alphaproteobacteria bacterium 62-8]
MIAGDIQAILPELIIATGGMLLLVVGVWTGDKSLKLLSALSVALLAVAGVALIVAPETATAFNGSFIADPFARFVKILILLGSAASIILAQSFLQREGINRFEFPLLILFATVGMMFMVSAGSLIALYMGLELQNLALYVLAAFHRDSLRSSEAGLKYFVLSALSSGLLLYGISLIYGFSGTTMFTQIAMVVQQSGVNIGLIFGMVFFIAGLIFKISAVPFHMWTPDVYEGAPTPITALFSTAPKVAAMGMVLRGILGPFPDAIHEWQQIIIIVSVLSMALGAVAAIGQPNIKRMMAYSSIGHMGYALLGLAAGTGTGVRSVLIYLLIYVVTNAGVFGCILAMQRDGKATESISDLAGLARTRPGLAFVFASLMFSLAGIPPLAGFFAKFYVFLAVIEAQLYVLAVIGVVTSVIGAYYYLRIVKIMYFDDPAPAFDKVSGPGLGSVLAASGAFTFLFIVGAAPLLGAATIAAHSLLP